MLKEIRLQWYIAWSQVKRQQLVKFWSIIVLVGFTILVTMGYAVKGKHSRVYIPFQDVLKKNFLL